MAGSRRDPPAPPEPRRSGAATSLDRLLGQVLGPTARKRGFAEATLLSEWASVIGASLAARCQPVRVEFPRGRAVGGTLHLHARGGAALELQHLAPQLVERINGYFGFAAVGRIRLVQAPPPVPRRPPEPPNVRALTAEEELELARSLEPLLDQPLGQALLDLGRLVRGTGRR